MRTSFIARRIGFTAFIGLLFSLMIAVVPAYAADPETHRSPTADAPAKPASLPASIDSDVYAYTISPNFRTFFVASGHLVLTLNGNVYKGFFTDYSGAKSYSASATTDPTAPVLTLTTKNGKFVFQMDSYFGTGFYSGTTTSMPKKLGAVTDTNKAYFSASAHHTTTISYNVIFSQRIGKIIDSNNEMTGTLTITYDTNNRISGGAATVLNSKGAPVTAQITNTGYFSSSYLYMAAKLNGKYFGISGTFSGSSVSGNAFSGSGADMSLWVWSGSPA